MIPEHIKELVELGNGVGGIKVSATSLEEIRELLRKSFENQKLKSEKNLNK